MDHKTYSKMVLMFSWSKVCKQIYFFNAKYATFFLYKSNSALLFCLFHIRPFWFSYLIMHIGPWPNKQQYLCMSLNICVWRLSILCQLTLFFPGASTNTKRMGMEAMTIQFPFDLSLSFWPGFIWTNGVISVTDISMKWPSAVFHNYFQDSHPLVPCFVFHESFFALRL